MNNIITREIINKNIKFIENTNNKTYDYNTLCARINAVKKMLVDKGAQKGDSVAIIHHTINSFHLASIFACCELGLKFLICDMPASIESLPYCKMAVHKPKFTIADNIKHLLINKMVEKYSNIIIYEKDLENFYHSGNDIKPWKVFPEDVLLITSTSGTTNWSKTMLYNHAEIYSVSMRNADICGFKQSDRVILTKNIHHGGSLMIMTLPSLIKCDYHVASSMPDFPTLYKRVEEGSKAFTILIKKIVELKLNKISFVSEPILDLFLQTVEKVIGKFENKLIISLYASIISPKLIKYCEKYNVEFLCFFGSLDCKVNPLTFNHITKDSTYIPMYIGKFVDDFYKIYSFEDGIFKFTNQDWDKPRMIEDKFEMLDDGSIILKHRILDENSEIRIKTAEIVKCDFAVVQNGNDKYLALFDMKYEINEDMKKLGYKNILHIDKEFFYAETKLNYDALRGHFIYYDNKMLA